MCRVYQKGMEEAQSVQKAAGAQWKCKQPSGSGQKTAGGNGSARKSAGRNWSEALGLRCRDKSGIGAVAATFLFRGCQRKERVSGKKNLSSAVTRLPGVAGGKVEVAGSSAEDRKCQEQYKGAVGDVGGAAELQLGPAEAGNGNRDWE